MRYFSIRNGLLVVGLQLSMLGCVGIPDEAPQEFHTAEAALERADQRDVDDYLPNTLDKAETQLEAATDLWKKSRDRDVKKDERSQLEKQATEQAAQVTAMAEQAIQLGDQVKAWDNNIQSYTQMVQERQDAMAQLKQLQDQNRELAVAGAAAQNREQPQQVAANTPDISLRGPVAYFSAGSTDVDPRYADNINSLAKTLTQDPNTKVTLAGFADPRGDKELNDRLARERAESVAAILRDRGVSADQIVVQAWPGTSGKHMKGKRSQAQLQLDRRVEAYISTASNTQQGQPQQR
ncbi:MAG TPA: OmpA family protein [Oligoflexus sp.]|uniref:OmpA family protein n=1 Tax=Oligoflexus sp. TaxID=1971216 RepID=UPI002D7EA983|nr:OmpA family protein [Oligoflexus sp.]HET9241662.1 OmpA family protein [Oligoflexus sp.]